MLFALQAFAILALVATQQAPIRPSPHDQSLQLTEKFRRMLLRNDAQQMLTAYVTSKRRSRTQIVSDLRQAGFDYTKNKNGCEYLYGGASTGQAQASVSAFVYFCAKQVGAKVGYSPF